jgi:hypothetical protein
MANTTNYNWETPDDTDLVKDGAAAIRTLGSSIDTTTKALNPSTTLGDIEYRSATANTNTRLAIGTTGQVLSVVGGVPAWATSDDANAIQNAIVDAKGDIISATAADTPARLAVGANGTVLTADSAEATGLKWATPAGGSTFVGAKAYGTTNQSISNNTVTTITWANEEFDTDAIHSTSTNTERLTIPSGKTGYWQITASIGYDTNATGVRQIRLSKNGTYVNNEQVNATSSFGNIMGYSNILYLTATDYITLEVYQTSGGSLDVIKSADTSYFAANFIGA